MSTVFPVELFIPDDSTALADPRLRAGQVPQAKTCGLESTGYSTAPADVPQAKTCGELLQAFTRDVSAGGLCLEVKIFEKHFEKFIQRPESRPLGLTINPTFSRTPIKASARIAWFRKKENPPSYLIGVSYTEIDPHDRNRLIRHAQWLLWLPRVLWATGLFLIALVMGLFFHNQFLIRENQKLVNQIVESASKKSDIASQLYELQRRKILLTDVVSKQENVSLELQTIESDRQKLQSSYRALEERGRSLDSSALEKMYGWIRSHQNLRTGLVASHEGDPALEGIAYTYDQSLAAQSFILFGDLKDAEAILLFFDERAAKKDGGFFNAYDTADGRSTDQIVSTGPNIWVGIAALQYEHRAKDGRFLPLARQIGDWVLSFVDEEGGLPGGPSVNWYSTEHNLDAYAFFSMLYKETKEERYQTARDRSLAWIKKYAYSAIEKRMQRGKGDSTIATDTFSWALAALGPETLKTIDFDPEAIIEFAENNCGVTVDFIRPDGKKIQVKGFDFAKAQNIGRGGVLSTEWTAQMIVAYRVLSKYFESLKDENKAALYSDKAKFYLNELQKMIITSPSKTGQGRGCLPYASVDDADTGHGWRSPKGRRTGSVAGTAYGIFAWSDANPFDLESMKDRSK